MRILVVLLAYACAALMAPLLLIAHGAVREGFSGDFAAGVTVTVLGLFASMAAIYALPVAVPVIAATEWYGIGDWRIFAVSCVVLGGFIATLFLPSPFSWDSIDRDIVFVVPLMVVACVMTYWLVAWKLLPPSRRAEPVT